MTFQQIVVLALVLVALFFAVSGIMKKRKSFSPKGDCGDDCGCGKS